MNKCILYLILLSANTSWSAINLPPDLPGGTYATENAFPGILFADPVALVTPPGENNRLFVLEQIGRISLIPDLSSPTNKVTFLDIQSRVRANGNEEGLLGLAFHPNYHRVDEPGFGSFFVFYQATVNSLRHWRLSRFSVNPSNPNLADAASEQFIITQRDQASNHNGGDLHFGDDGYLYIAVGDEGGANNSYDNSQHIDKDFFGAVFRIDVDQHPENLVPNAHAAIHTNTYRVPADNPFVGATTFNGLNISTNALRSEIWAIGLRNPWRMSFDRPTGRLFVADVGQGAREEINILHPSVFATNAGIPNYGWSFREGFIAFNNGPGGSNSPAGFTHIDPIHDYPRSQGTSVTGGLVYRGARYPELDGDYLFSDYNSGRIWAIDDPGGAGQSVSQIATDNRIAGFGIDPSTGEVLLADDNSNRSEDDQIKRLVRNTTPGGNEPPPLLSQTGAFSDLATLTPATNVIPYAINVPFWSDHAIKTRWFSLPDSGDTMTWARDESWTFPTGQIWIKQFDLDLNRDQPGTQLRRLETRFLVKTTDDVYGITYRWNDAQTDAELVDENGFSEDFDITENGQTYSQTWHYPSQSDCRVCHNEVSGLALGFNTRQLNIDVGTNEYQLAAFETAGYFDAAVPAAQTLPVFYTADNTQASLRERGRSFLAVNCVSCHQPGGVSQGEWNARPEVPIESSGILDGGLLNPLSDGFNRVLAPGDPAHSMLTQRLEAVDSGTTLLSMPPLATAVKNQAAIDLLNAWALAENSAPQTGITTNSSPTLLPNETMLSASTSDDGFPRYPGTLSLLWSKISGPGMINFSATDSNQTSASFSAPGSYQLQLMVSDGATNVLTQTTIDVGESYAHWKNSVFTPQQMTNTLISGDFADPDADGASNVIEYFHGGHPMVVDAPLFTVSFDSGFLTLDFRMRKIFDPDFSSAVYVAEILGIPLYGPSHLDHFVIADDGVWQDQRARDLTPIDSAPRRFLGIQLTLPQGE